MGNVASQTINGSQSSLSYNAANELTAAGSTTYSFDGNGNGNETGSSAGLNLAYNAQDQTTSATPPGGSATSYSYTDAGQTQRFSSGSTSFQYDVTGLSAMTTVTGTTYFTRLPNGTLLSERTPSGTDYYVVDGLGSVMAVANSAGNVVNSYSYDPFGNATGATEQVANPFRFDGQYLDQDTGFYKMGQRYCVPTLSLWTQEDASTGCPKNAQSLNRYTFVQNDPVNGVDPTGNQIINPGFVVCFENCLGGELVETGCIEACFECGSLLPTPASIIPCRICIACAGSAAIGCASECSEFLFPDVWIGETPDQQRA